MLTNIPNILTLLRIALIPAVVGLMLFDTPLTIWLALFIYTIAALTDYVDGYLARELDQVSAFGKFMDPIADKLMVGVVLFMVVALDRVEGLWILPVIIIMMREFIVSGLREFLGPYNVKVPVSKLAKWKTFIQMLFIGFLIAGPHGTAVLPHATTIGHIGITLAAVLTVMTGWAYLKVGLRFICELDQSSQP